jgi:hypothetical protein
VRAVANVPRKAWLALTDVAIVSEKLTGARSDHSDFALYGGHEAAYWADALSKPIDVPAFIDRLANHLYLGPRLVEGKTDRKLDDAIKLDAYKEQLRGALDHAIATGEGEAWIDPATAHQAERIRDQMAAIRWLRDHVRLPDGATATVEPKTKKRKASKRDAIVAHLEEQMKRGADPSELFNTYQLEKHQRCSRDTARKAIEEVKKRHKLH